MAGEEVAGAPTEPTVERPLQWLVLALSLVLGYVLMPLAPAICVGGFIAIAGYGPFERLVARLHGRRALASWLATLAVLVAVFAPIALMAWLTISEAAAGIAWIASQLQRLGGLSGATHHLPRALQQALPALQQHWAGELAGLGEQAAAFAPAILGALGALVAQGFLAIVTVLYAFRQGPAMVDFLRRVSPLRAEHTEALIGEVDEVARGLFWGNLVTSVVHGVAAAIGYAIVGVPEVVFLGALTLVASFVPGIGTATIWLPVAIVLWFTASHWRALVLLGWGVLVIGGIDQVLRPLFSRGHARIPNLLMFLTLFGGIMVFGLKGLLLGPLAGALTLTALRLVARPEPVRLVEQA